MQAQALIITIVPENDTLFLLVLYRVRELRGRVTYASAVRAAYHHRLSCTGDSGGDRGAEEGSAGALQINAKSRGNLPGWRRLDGGTAGR
jgi:hypothetical protein